MSLWIMIDSIDILILHSQKTSVYEDGSIMLATEKKVHRTITHHSTSS